MEYIEVALPINGEKTCVKVPLTSNLLRAINRESLGGLHYDKVFQSFVAKYGFQPCKKLLMEQIKEAVLRKIEKGAYKIREDYFYEWQLTEPVGEKDIDLSKVFACLQDACSKY